MCTRRFYKIHDNVCSPSLVHHKTFDEFRNSYSNIIESERCIYWMRDSNRRKFFEFKTHSKVLWPQGQFRMYGELSFRCRTKYSLDVRGSMVQITVIYRSDDHDWSLRFTANYRLGTVIYRLNVHRFQGFTNTNLYTIYI